MSYVEDLRRATLVAPGAAVRMDDVRVEMRQQLTLEELRKTRSVTQAQLAEVLGVSQPRVSQLERQGTARIDTFRDYVEALGGRLETVAVFGDERITVEFPPLTYTRRRQAGQSRRAHRG